MMREQYTQEREVLGKVLALTSQTEATRIRDILGSIASGKTRNAKPQSSVSVLPLVPPLSAPTALVACMQR
jgi:hypothetical protein